MGNLEASFRAAVALVGACLAAGCVATAQKELGGTSAVDRVGASEVPSGWLARAQQSISDREYRASHNRLGLQAPNRAHELRTYFEPHGIRVHERAEDEVALLALSLVGIGRGDALAEPESGRVSSRGARVEIRRGWLLEWYENSREGLEQGFSLSERPPGEGPLALELAASHASVSRRGDALIFTSAAGRKLRYAELRAWDATGRELAARLGVTAAERVRLEVDEADAVYPVHLDPLLTATWETQLESNQADAELGTRVASAGDVNGDGYADVIVGAPFYDAGELDEGAAFVFLGSAAGLADADPVSADAQLESNQLNAFLGRGAAGAGDVNGDGYDDVIVGANHYAAGEASEGAAWVFLGSATGIADGNPSTAHAQLESNQLQAFLGWHVAGAGDVNGDGYADVIVGAHLYSAGEPSEGAAFVFLGSAAGISDGNPATAHAQLESDQEDAFFGWGVAGVGDVNGDGYDDVIVGAQHYDAGESAEGAAFVFLGSASGIADGDPGTAHAQLEANQAGANLGQSVAGAGDVNGDGYADVIVGAPLYDVSLVNEGAAFVFQGGASGIADGDPASADAQILSYQASGELGSGVAGAGDVNGDGYADVIVGAYRYDGAQGDEGAAFVFLGGSAGIPDGDPFSADAQVFSGQGGAALGGSVAGAGDVNGDGYADVIVGAEWYDAGQHNEGAAFVLLGGAAGIEDGDSTSAHAKLDSNQASALLGYSAAGAGDVNGDGYADVIVGAPLYDAGQQDEGAAFVFLGSAAGIPDGYPATAHAQLESNQTDAQLGTSVAGAGDVNGDGYADVIVGAPLYDAGQADEGAAFVFLGSAAGVPDGNPATAHTQLESDQAGAQLGKSVAGAGDCNGDGYADVIVGADRYDAGENDEGAAFVFLGSGAGISGGGPVNALAQLESDQAEAYLGQSVAGAGDTNGDGYADLIVGAPFYDAGEADEGAAFVFLGGAAGVESGDPASAAAQIESDQADARLGNSVAGAGDVNGDGYADLIVGALEYDAGEAHEGAAFVFLGHASGIVGRDPPTAHAQLESNQSSARLGSSVAGAGDVNGDGFADVLVGAYAYDAGQTLEGAAFVFLGSATGVSDGDPASAHAQLESDQTSTFLGFSAAGAGDVNGDGFADLIAGAYRYTAPTPTEGAAFVFLGNGNRNGYPVLAQQLRGDGSGVAVPPWGRSLEEDAFQIALSATHPDGQGRVKLEVEVCPPDVGFEHPSCVSQTSGSWIDVTAPSGSARVVETVGGLAPGTLYRWRARLHRAHHSLTPPLVPPRGPWRHPAAQSPQADIRALPEPGGNLLVLAGILALVVLRCREISLPVARRSKPRIRLEVR
jgi:hypothetical protein